MGAHYLHARYTPEEGAEGYAEADYETRAKIEQRHKDYALSRLYFLANDPEVPAAFRAEVAANWGLPTDEFVDNGHFPFQIYVRAARRMVGRYVLRERDLTQERYKPDGVCAGSYGIDSGDVDGLIELLAEALHAAINMFGDGLL